MGLIRPISPISVQPAREVLSAPSALPPNERDHRPGYGVVRFHRPEHNRVVIAVFRRESLRALPWLRKAWQRLPPLTRPAWADPFCRNNQERWQSGAHVVHRRGLFAHQRIVAKDRPEDIRRHRNPRHPRQRSREPGSSRNGIISSGR